MIVRNTDERFQDCMSVDKRSAIRFHMKRTSRANLPVLFDTDLPSMATHCSQSECGFSLYRNVLIRWDEDKDERILTFVDEMPHFIRGQLLVVQEHEAVLALIWRDRIPEGYEIGAEIEVERDIWTIHESTAR